MPDERTFAYQVAFFQVTKGTNKSFFLNTKNSAQCHKVAYKLCNNSQNIPWDLKGILNLYYICKCVKKVVINLSSLKIDSPSTLSKAYLYAWLAKV